MCSQLWPQTGSDDVESRVLSAVQTPRALVSGHLEPVLMCPAGGATPLVATTVAIICKPMGKW